MYTMNYIITAKLYRWPITPIIWHCMKPQVHIKNYSALPKMLLCKVNDCHVTYHWPQYEESYLLAKIYLISSWKIKLFNHLPATMVVIGRFMHIIASIAFSCLRYKIYIWTAWYYASSSWQFLPVNKPNCKASAPSTLVHYHHWLLNKQ